MRETDVRSKCIAIVPDALLNAHLLTGPVAGVAAAGQEMLDRLGFGLIQLPPPDVSPERARRALDLAIDQVRDYAANGYRIISVGLKALPHAGLWQDYLTPEMNRRGLVLSEAVILETTDALGAIEQRLSLGVRRG
jgi:hypothetical protein